MKVIPAHPGRCAGSLGCCRSRRRLWISVKYQISGAQPVIPPASTTHWVPSKLHIALGENTKLFHIFINFYANLEVMLEEVFLESPRSFVAHGSYLKWLQSVPLAWINIKNSSRNHHLSKVIKEGMEKENPKMYIFVHSQVYSGEFRGWQEASVWQELGRKFDFQFSFALPSLDSCFHSAEFAIGCHPLTSPIF